MLSLRSPRLWLLSVVLFGAICCAVAVSLWWMSSSFKSWETNNLSGKLPAKIETVGDPQTSSSMSIFELLLPIRHDGCGGAIFRLDGATQRNIASDGLSLLQKARHARDASVVPDYDVWRKTPVPSDWMSEGIWYGLECMHLEEKQLAAIRAMALSSDAYYTKSGDLRLVISADAALVVLTYEH